MTDVTAFAVFGLGLLTTVGVGEALRAKAGWQPEASRRFVHAFTGLLVVGAPFLFERPGGVFLLAASFVVVNLWAVPRRVFPGMHAIQRRSWGTVTFPLALLFALVTCWTLDVGRVYILQAAFLVLAVSDPAASAIGTTVGRPGRYRIGSNVKSIAGSLTFFVTAFSLTALALALWGPISYSLLHIAGIAFVAAVLATGAEALAEHGWDNFFVVVAVIVPLTVAHVDMNLIGLLVVALAVAVVFGLAAYGARFLDASGALAAAGLAFSVVVLGPEWAAPGAAFFVLSSLLSKVGKRRKANAEARAEKGSRRDAGQVYANGGVAWGLLVAYVFNPSEALYWGYVGAFAAAAADTWGTEVGTLVGGPTRLVWSGRRVPPGTSGGVSIAGTLGALAGAGVVFLAAWLFAGEAFAGLELMVAAWLIVGSGFAASLVDSLIGATAQALYRADDGLLTERPGRGERTFDLARGRRWITNDRVNLACTLTGASIPILFLALS